MAQYLHNLKISSEISELIDESKEFLYLISPYVKLSKVYKNQMKSVDTNKIDFVIVYKNGFQLSTDDYNFFKNLGGTKILKCTDLHAKCYINESWGIITSLNLYEYSQTNNFEMGVKFSKKEDPDLYEKALKDAKRIQKIGLNK